MINSAAGIFPYIADYKDEYQPFDTAVSKRELHSVPVAQPISIEALKAQYLLKNRDSQMFVPAKFMAPPTYVNPASTVCPVTHLDVNGVGLVGASSSINISLSDGVYRQSNFMVVSRTPLAQDDPNTYIALPPDHQPNKSKLFAKYAFAASSNGSETKDDSNGGASGGTAAGSNGSNSTSYTSIGNNSSSNGNSNSTSTNTNNTINSTNNTNTANTAPDKTPFGSNVNPLIPDPFSFVHLTPGCNLQYIRIKSTSSSSSTQDDNSNYLKSRPLWGRKKSNNSTELASPKTSLVRNSSSFLARAFPSENFSKRLAGSESVLYAYNGRAFNLYSVKPNTSSKISGAYEIIDDYPLLRVVFMSTITCADMSLSSANKLDIIIGFASGDIFWYDPFTQRYTRFNKGGVLTGKASVTCISWNPDSTGFIAGFSDGSFLEFDRAREDNENNYYEAIKNGVEGSRFLRVVKSKNSSKTTNPVAHYKISGSPVTSVSWGDSGICFTCDDGFFRLFDQTNCIVREVVPGYYGGLLCSSWSPDGRFLIVGGEDDLISVFESGLRQMRLVARLEGHFSWIRDLQFDAWRSPPKFDSSPVTYRIGSVGDDGKFLIWEFSPRLLPKLKSKKHQKIVKVDETDFHQMIPKNAVPFIQPIGTVDCNIGRLSGIQFEADGVWITAAGGDVRKWDRPK